ncbi:MAG: hypothetical protein HDT44_01595 [Ruminococcaceae bacterium]|nr:hypothetical protein [Oscillospiraceae bacterium]
MSIQEKLYTERRVGMEEGIEVGEKKGRQAERQEIMEKMRKTGMTEEQIKLILAN